MHKPDGVSTPLFYPQIANANLLSSFMEPQIFDGTYTVQSEAGWA